jgi:hypothetical protein
LIIGARSDDWGPQVLPTLRYIQMGYREKPCGMQELKFDKDPGNALQPGRFFDFSGGNGRRNKKSFPTCRAFQI